MAGPYADLTKVSPKPSMRTGSMKTARGPKTGKSGPKKGYTRKMRSSRSMSGGRY